MARGHEAAAKKLATLKAKATADIDQANAQRRDAAEAFENCEYFRLQRAASAAAEKARSIRSGYETAIAEATAEVERTCPAREIISELRQRAMAQADALRNIADFDAGGSRTEMVKRREKRHAEVMAWTALYQQLPRLFASPTPFTDLAALLQQHVKTLPSLGHYHIEIPDYEMELAHAT